MRQRFKIFIAWILGTIALFTCACRNAQVVEESLSAAVVVDPTTVLEGSSFLQDANGRVRQLIDSCVLPDDSFLLFSVASNSNQQASSLNLDFPTARNLAEKKRFIEFRAESSSKADGWFAQLKPCGDPREECSDIYSSISAAAQALKRTDSERKLLLVLSDMQENVREYRSLPPESLRGIDVVVLYAFPKSRNPGDYEEHRRSIMDLMLTGRPSTVVILFPAEASAFDLASEIKKIRRGRGV